LNDDIIAFGDDVVDDRPSGQQYRSFRAVLRARQLQALLDEAVQSVVLLLGVKQESGTRNGQHETGDPMAMRLRHFASSTVMADGGEFELGLRDGPALRHLFEPVYRSLTAVI
jgi:hypothetical protein